MAKFKQRKHYYYFFTLHKEWPRRLFFQYAQWDATNFSLPACLNSDCSPLQPFVAASYACAPRGMRSGSGPRRGRGSWTTSWTWLESSGPTWRRYWARSETPKISWKSWRTLAWTLHSSNNRLRLLRYVGPWGRELIAINSRQRNRRAIRRDSGRNALSVLHTMSLYPSTRPLRQRRMVWGRSWSLSGPSELTLSLPVEKPRNLKSRRPSMRWEINTVFLW